MRIKNESKVARSIRPYIDRNILVVVKPSEVVDIDLIKTGWNVKKDPVSYFRSLGFAFAPKESAPAVTAEKPASPKVKAPETPKVVIPEVKAPEVTIPTVTIPDVETPKVSAPDSTVKVSIEKGDIKHFHPGNKIWHTVRVVKDWAIGRVIYNETDKAYFKVDSIDGELLVCSPLTEEAAVKTTGVKA